MLVGQSFPFEVLGPLVATSKALDPSDSSEPPTEAIESNRRAVRFAEQHRSEQGLRVPRSVPQRVRILAGPT